MSWTTGDCDCGNTVDFGFYSSTHEDEHSEINITVVCGECVRERDGIPSEEILDAEFEVFKSEVAKHGLRHVINWDKVESKSILDILRLICHQSEINNPDDTFEEAYIAAAWSVIPKNPSGQLQSIPYGCSALYRKPPRGKRWGGRFF